MVEPDHDPVAYDDHRRDVDAVALFHLLPRLLVLEHIDLLEGDASLVQVVFDPLAVTACCAGINLDLIHSHH
jgi:hypothetical protein